jgi:putative transposase
VRSAREVEDERLLERIREVHGANYCAYGYRRTWKALTRAGEHAPRCQVQRLMRAHGMKGAKRRGKPWRTTTRTQMLAGGPISSTATSQHPRRMSFGLRRGKFGQ